MDSMVMSINEIPWIMPPVALAAGLLAASLVRAAIQIKIFPGFMSPFGSMSFLIWCMS